MTLTIEERRLRQRDAQRRRRAANPQPEGYRVDGKPRRNKDWQNDILPLAASIVESYSTGVTLRQLFYRLVAAQVVENKMTVYSTLSRYTAELRREGRFPDLIEAGRRIQRPLTFNSPDEALDWLTRRYRRDRTEGQPVKLMLAVEKAGLVEQLSSWFDHLGIPIVAFGGYSSQTLKDKLVNFDKSKNAVIIYAGDFDATGHDIVRDARERTGVTFEHIALTREQVEEYGLPENTGKDEDGRSAAWTALHGSNVQVELDALDPNDLRALYQTAIDRHWDTAIYAESVAQERDDIEYLTEVTA